MASVSADAWVQVAALVGTGIVGMAAGGMRTWARRVEHKIDHQSGQLAERLDLVSSAVAKTNDELVHVRERLTAAETALRFTTGVMVSGQPPWRHRRRDDPPPMPYDVSQDDG